VSRCLVALADLDSALKSIDECILTIAAEGEGLRLLERFCKRHRDSGVAAYKTIDDELPSIFGVSTVSLKATSTEELGTNETTLGESSAVPGS
jgi:hypothetical protein